MQELRAHFPELLPMVGQFYLRDGTLHFCGEDGERIRLRSVTGVQQGDPLGPVLFALGIHPALRAVQQRHPLVHILAYLDDVHLVGPQGAVYDAFQTLRAQFAAIGLHTRKDKNLVWTPSQSYFPVWFWPAASATIAHGGYDVLGVPCCTEEELPARVLARCMDEAAKGRPNFAQKLAALRRLPEQEPKRGPHAALLLLRRVRCPRWGTCCAAFRRPLQRGWRRRSTRRSAALWQGWWQGLKGRQSCRRTAGARRRSRCPSDTAAAGTACPHRWRWHHSRTLQRCWQPRQRWWSAACSLRRRAAARWRVP
jgi:hypothetical protein